MTEAYIKFPRQLIAATHWISQTTGERIKLTASEKVLWLWMVDRFNFFKSNGKQWFDNQSDMAHQSGCSLSTVTRFMKDLKLHGHLVVTPLRRRGYAVSNSNVITSDLTLCIDETVVATTKSTSITEALKPVAEDPIGHPEPADERVANYTPIDFNLPVAKPVEPPKVLQKLLMPSVPSQIVDIDDGPVWEVRSSGTSN